MKNSRETASAWKAYHELLYRFVSAAYSVVCTLSSSSAVAPAVP